LRRVSIGKYTKVLVVGAMPVPMLGNIDGLSDSRLREEKKSQENHTCAEYLRSCGAELAPIKNSHTASFA
jgi:hypothetical protein